MIAQGCRRTSSQEWPILTLLKSVVLKGVPDPRLQESPEACGFSKQASLPQVDTREVWRCSSLWGILSPSDSETVSTQPAFWTLHSPRRTAHTELAAAFSEKPGHGCRTQRRRQGAQRSRQVPTTRATHIPQQCGYTVAPDASLNCQHQQACETGCVWISSILGVGTP